MQRIGELLVKRGVVNGATLARTLGEQADSGKRLCSLLIQRGLLDPDDAARALGEQLGVPAVLQKHLEHREPELTKLLLAGLARSLVVLPIGRMRNGDLIVCARDPSTKIKDAIARVIGAPTRLVGTAQPRIGRDHFRDRVTGTQAFAQLPERTIGDARHGRDGEVVRQGIGSDAHDRESRNRRESMTT